METEFDIDDVRRIGRVCAAALVLQGELQSLVDSKVSLHSTVETRANEANELMSQYLRYKDSDIGISSDNAWAVLEGADDTVRRYWMQKLQGKKSKLSPIIHSYFSSFWFIFRRNMREQITSSHLDGVKNLFTHLALTSDEGSTGTCRTQHLEWGNISHLYDQKMVFPKESLGELQFHLSSTSTGGLMFLAVLGVQGSGKTELVRHLFYDSEDIRTQFQVRAWVTVLPQDAGFQLSLFPDGVTGEKVELYKHARDLRSRICKTLSRKKFLIVFDGVRDVGQWCEFESVFPAAGSGNLRSKVVVTSRDEDNSFRARGDFLIRRVKELGDDDCWSLLLQQTGRNDDNQVGEAVKEKMLSKLHGVPMAVRQLGGVLRDTDSSHWEEVIDKVPSQVVDLKAKGAAIHMLKFSIWSLPPVYMACLVYLFCFPYEWEFPVRKLLQLWLGEGFFSGLSTELKTPPEDLAKLCLKELVNRELIKVTSWRKFDGSPKRCQLSGHAYNLLTKDEREWVQSIFKVMAASPSDLSLHERFRQLYRVDGIMEVRSCICLTKSFPKSLTTATPSVDIYNCFHKYSEQTAHHFGLVRLLDLEGVYNPVLPNLKKLLLLSYLCLRSTAINSIPPAVGDLPLLETLDLKHTRVSTLPASIWGSTSLRYLYANGVRVDGYQHKTKSPDALTNLHTVTGLYIASLEAISQIFYGCTKVKKLGFTCNQKSIDAVLKWVSKKLLGLESLKIRCVDGDANSSLISLTEHQHLHKLYLLGKIENGQDHHKPEEASDKLVVVEMPLLLSDLLPRCLTKLTLSMSNLRDDPMPVLGENFPELIILRLLADSYTGTQLTCSSRSWFLKLRCLKLWKLAQLKALTITAGGMPLLQVLELRMCNSMEKLNGIQHISGSSELILTNMPKKFLEDIRAMNNVRIKPTVCELKSSYYQEEVTHNRPKSPEKQVQVSSHDHARAAPKNNSEISECE